MSEAHMRRRVVKALAELDAVPVENAAACPGTPDVNCTEGWLELKKVRSWPKHSRTPLRVPHFKPEQRIWLRRRWRADGRAFLLLQVGRDWVLLHGDVAADLLGHAPKEDLLDAACLWMPRGLDRERLMAALRSHFSMSPSPSRPISSLETQKGLAPRR